jgi:hypothetical protein
MIAVSPAFIHTPTTTTTTTATTVAVFLMDMFFLLWKKKKNDFFAAVYFIPVKKRPGIRRGGACTAINDGWMDSGGGERERNG